MKITSLLAVVSTLWFTTAAIADETHEADRGIEGTLRAEVNERHVHINVHKGVVTLEGKVATEADRQRIEALARNTAGVAAIKDKLQVTMPEPGAFGPSSVTAPVYATAPPVVVPPTAVVAPPPAVVVPEYPMLRVQPATTADQAAANAIASQLRTEALPATAFSHLTISVANGTASVQGTVDSKLDHDAIINSIQRAGGTTAIYDQMLITGR